jgi:hypothetical protein
LLKEVYQERAAITELTILQYLVPVLAALVSPPWHHWLTPDVSQAKLILIKIPIDAL